MPWIMLTKKLPVQPSPPKLSIHWAIPDGDSNMAKEQRDEFAIGEIRHRKKPRRYDEPESLDSDYFIENDLFGKVPNYTKAMAIMYLGVQIRVLPHEFNVMTAEKLHEYLESPQEEGFSAAYELVNHPDATATLLMTDLIEGDRKVLYDAALLDGTHMQAMAVALGVEGAESYPPGIGWWRCVPGYAQYFCDEWELKED